VNLAPQAGSVTFGRLLETTHVELDNVYGQLAAQYLPYPVVAQDMDGKLVPALCYIVPEMAPGAATADHIMPLLTTAEELAFPPWYLDKIRSFLPGVVS
jgi:hypothetical protein